MATGCGCSQRFTTLSAGVLQAVGTGVIAAHLPPDRAAIATQHHSDIGERQTRIAVTRRVDSTTNSRAALLAVIGRSYPSCGARSESQKTIGRNLVTQTLMGSDAVVDVSGWIPPSAKA